MHTHTPVIIRRSSHNISRNLISPNALKIMYRLHDNGFKAFLVGGSVRDLLIGRTPKDFDLATDATPAEIKKLFRNCRLVGRRFRLAHLHFKDEVIEVATFRKGGDQVDPEESDSVLDEESQDQPETPRHILGHLHKSDEGVLLRDNLFGTPEEDAWRRDFTVNALSYDIADFSIIDYVGGMEDLQQGLIRTIGDPASRFAEDPVRMLRAIRFAAQLGFTIEHHSWEAMAADARRITLASPARLFDEVMKLFLSGAAENCWLLLCKSGLAAAIFPDLMEWSAGKTGDRAVKSAVWIDRIVQSGCSISTPLLLALLFGEYLTESGDKAVSTDSPLQMRVERSLACFMKEISGTLFIPQRTIMRLREILLLLQRLLKVPGRKPENVIARPGFADALEFLRYSAVDNQALGKTVGWWERYVGDNVLPPVKVTDSQSADEPRRRRHPHRRRRKNKKIA